MGTCNPYTKPGFVSHAPYPSWQPYDTSCEAQPLFANLLASVPRAGAGPVASMRPTSLSQKVRKDLERTLANRTVLLVGDAVERAMVQHLCSMLGSTSVGVTADHAFGSALKNMEATNPVGDTLLADYCYIEQYDAFFSSFYHYGTDTDDLWREQPTFFPPQQFESRMERLLTPYLRALRAPRTSAQLPLRRNKVDLAIFSTGLWDLAAWAMEDARAGVNPAADLSAPRLKSWRARAVDMLESLRSATDQAPIAWRSMAYTSAHHGSVETLLTSTRASFQGNTEVRFATLTQAATHPYAYNNRIAQLNQAREATLYLAGDDAVRGSASNRLWTARNHPSIGDIPYAEVTTGQEAQPSHGLLMPSLDPHAFLYWEMVLAELANA